MNTLTIHGMLDEARISGCDINEHIPTLMSLAASADQIVELGVNLGTSTLAFLSGGRGKIDSWDIVRTKIVDHILNAADGRWTFHHDDSRSGLVPPCDLLFIDSLHTATQLASELAAHHYKVADKIVLHDTESFGYKGEDGQIGLRMALIDFLLSHADQWKIAEHYRNNNGLTILQRIG